MTEVAGVDKYLETGAHLGSEYKTGYMRKFIFRAKQDRLKIIDLNIIDKRLKIAAQMIAQYNPEDVVFVARRTYAQPGAKLCAKTLGCNYVVGRFLPGLFTNPLGKEFMEPRLIVLNDPFTDKQALSEAKKLGIPVIAMCSTMNKAKNVDLVIPINNKGKKSLSLAYWALTKEVLKARGTIQGDSEFDMEMSDFEYQKKR